MLRRSILAGVFLGLGVSPAAAQPASSQAASPGPVFAPPAPATAPGEPVYDSTGSRIGRLVSLIQSEAGPMAVVEIDGVLVGLRTSSLNFEASRAVAARTKAEILAAARVPGAVPERGAR